MWKKLFMTAKSIVSRMYTNDNDNNNDNDNVLFGHQVNILTCQMMWHNKVIKV